MTLIQKVKKYISSNSLFLKNDTIIVGVSGGPDSTALLNILHSLQYELGLRLYVAHYNHNLRKNSYKDQKFVENLCAKLNLPCIVKSWLKQESNPRGSIEEIAREKRIKFLTEVAKKKKADAIALGHNLDDLAETVLMRILRGTGMQGIRAIMPKRKLYGYNFIRPLLGTKRAAIENYLHKNKISYTIDKTNKSTVFFRNKIRLKLLPLIEKEYNPNIKEILIRFAENLSTDYNFIEKESARIFNKLKTNSKNKKNLIINIKPLLKLHDSTKRMIIRQSIENLAGNTNRISYTHLKEINDLINNRPIKTIVNLPNGIAVKKNPKNIVFKIN